MKNIFPDPITQFPKADIPLEGLTAYLSQADTHQTLYMQFKKRSNCQNTSTLIKLDLYWKVKMI